VLTARARFRQCPLLSAYQSGKHARALKNRRHALRDARSAFQFDPCKNMPLQYGGDSEWISAEGARPAVPALDSNNMRPP
jgi:hypothetical protein